MKAIIGKELLEHLRSVQFAVLLASSIVLFAVNGLVFFQRYSQRNSDYRLHVTEVEHHPSTKGIILYKRPNPLLFMSVGGEKHGPTGYDLGPKQTLAPLPAGPRNFKMPEVPDLDWAFIIKIIFSLYAILLGFEAVSGEKERGTLSQIFSNPVGRMKILTGKYLAIISSAAIALITGIITSLIIIGVFLPFVLSLPNLARMAFLFILALVYLSLFVFLSLFFSALILRSSIVLLVLLALWIFFAFFVPDASSVIAQKFSRVPSEYEMAKLVGPTIQKEVLDKINNLRDRIKKGELKTEKDVREQADLAYEQGQDHVRKIYADYDNAVQQRADLAREISRVSPVALFEYSTEDTVGTGPSDDARFFKDVRDYSRIYDNYVLKKVGKVAGTSLWNFATSVVLNGKSVFLQSPAPQEYPGDKSDFPRFFQTRTTLIDGLAEALWDIVGLLLWNITLAGLAFSAFIRADVR
jgi:ABC-type transport system involved in multi-copper enzyme maturation permease subunit